MDRPSLRHVVAELFDPAFVEPSVDFLTVLAGTGAALEFGIGTGRIVLPRADEECLCTASSSRSR